MDKAKMINLIECAKRDFPSCWQSTALDWICDALDGMGSHFTRAQVRGIVYRETGEVL